MNDYLGIHYILDFYNCNSEYLTSVSKINILMRKTSKIGKFNVVKSCFHQFNPYGVSGVMVLKESHFTIHTWPEYQYAAIDIFLCDTNVNIDEVIKYLSDVFETNIYRITKLERGKEINNHSKFIEITTKAENSKKNIMSVSLMKK